ncbi:hypothetical protein PVAP13_2KG022816 [Panicum virgatum]|uniref:Uncharacterized protein n=1 Tax=Panicum virgatum TaxID=38727 RepID=A0A8T0VWZ5_PANVG|nr:hypothetical protein PVAP13_2KG022816 [Panicum virgatum]
MTLPSPFTLASPSPWALASARTQAGGDPPRPARWRVQIARPAPRTRESRARRPRTARAGRPLGTCRQAGRMAAGGACWPAAQPLPPAARGRLAALLRSLLPQAEL